MKYIPLIAIVASALAIVGCTVATRERVVERPAPAVSERTVVYTDRRRPRRRSTRARQKRGLLGCSRPCPGRRHLTQVMGSG